ncbi:putative ankyrin repeat protein RF_0381 [Microplitis demolitor]|uniref:putative ankyrin repeat protein RF_0381 n=1 Tax=Microplitis demolitor TaxID=69319 RepID=UPI0004CDCA07|nr:putative ankyrin repeat protein RF_0381 [Microplitis demolitor]
MSQEKKKLTFGKDLNLKAIKGWIEKKAIDVNSVLTYCEEKGWTFVHIAADTSDEELLDYLLKKKANLNINNDDWGTPLHIAVTRENIKIVKRLIENGADINSPRGSFVWTPLHTAIENLNTEAIKLLIDKGADVNAACDDEIRTGCTPLHLAIETNNEEIVKLLMKKNVDVNATMKLFGSPIFSASTLGNSEIIKSLIKHGADINLPVDDKDSPYYQFTSLLIAVTFKHRQAVKILLQNGANVDAITDQADTALHLAVLHPDDGIVEELLNAGIDVNNFNRENKIAFDYCDDESTCKLLKEHIVKLKTAKIFIHKKNIDVILKDAELKNLRFECLQEIEKLKTTEIGTGLTFYELLNDIKGKLSVSNKNFDEISMIPKKTIVEKFPLYANLLVRRLNKIGKK